MKNIDYNKFLRFFMIFAIVGLAALFIIVNFSRTFAYEFYDLFPGMNHGSSNFITYPSVLYLYAIYICFMYLGSNDLKYIDTFIILSIFISTMRIISIIADGLSVTPFYSTCVPTRISCCSSSFLYKENDPKTIYIRLFLKPQICISKLEFSM
jgi:hypothetical protein